MPIPDYQTLMLPVLRLLADGAEHTAGSAIEALSDEFQLTSAEREQLVGSQRIGLMASRVHWAMTYLAQAGLANPSSRGHRPSGLSSTTDQSRRVMGNGSPRRRRSALGVVCGQRLRGQGSSPKRERALRPALGDSCRP
jgi:hypothetical protein